MKEITDQPFTDKADRIALTALVSDGVPMMLYLVGNLARTDMMSFSTRYSEIVDC